MIAPLVYVIGIALLLARYLHNEDSSSHTIDLTEHEDTSA